MTDALTEFALRAYVFSSSHDAAEGTYGHNYRLELKYHLSDDAAARAAETRIQKELIDRLHSRDLSGDRDLFGDRATLDDRTIARAIARKARELAAPIQLISVALRRTDMEAIEIVF